MGKVQGELGLESTSELRAQPGHIFFIRKNAAAQLLLRESRTFLFMPK